ncbi:hypothetical protein BRD56_10055 [Thermoplasmatales archaeon SW_10_69_26]|nr:MAG: hypothetical protein BRD56_10055 [Thermoplasmatales archaeon SW_10_69_26]
MSSGWLRGETLAAVPSTRPRTDRSVRALAWKILLANHRPSLGLDPWDQLVVTAGGPSDVKRLSLDETVPAEPWTQALGLLAEEIAEDPEQGLARIGRSFVDRWASMYTTLVEHLESRPRRMLELAVDEVVPWFFPDTDLAIEHVDDHRARLRPDRSLPVAFQAGLLEAFVDQIGAEVEVTVDGDRLLVDWSVDAHERPNPLAVLAEATRARFLTATIVPVLVGTALAFAQASLDTLRAGAALGAAAALHLSANLLNDVYDHRRGVDEANLTPTPFSGGSRVIQRGLLGSRRVLALAVGLAVLGGVLGSWLAATTGGSVLGLGVLGVGLGYAYSGDPFRLSHRGLGELAAGLVFGPLIVAGAHAVQVGGLSAQALLVGVPVGALMAALLAVNELPDAPWDERTGKRTLVVRVGEHAPWAIAGLLGLAYLAIVGLVGSGWLAWPALGALATLPLAVHVVRGVREAEGEADELVAYQAAALGLHATTGLLVAVGIAARGVA